MLVVVGIITAIVGMVLPSLMKARQAAFATKCLNNLRQLGGFYYIYAQANHDIVPLGVAGNAPAPFARSLPGPETPPAEREITTNHFLYVDGSPSSACGPFVSTGMIKERAGRIFYCPVEIHGTSFQYDTKVNPWPASRTDATTRISYAVRPVNVIWTKDESVAGGFVFTGTPKLVKQHSYALMAEMPQIPPYNHGGEANNFLHALYGDGSVRAVYRKSFQDELTKYISVGRSIPGKTKISAEACYQDDPNVKTMWWVIDHN